MEHGHGVLNRLGGPQHQVRDRRGGDVVGVPPMLIPGPAAAPCPAPQSAMVDEWAPLAGPAGPERDAAIRRLRQLQLRAARHQVAHMAVQSHEVGVSVTEIVEQAADEATVAVLARLDSFEGRSRFTTWAFK